MNRRSFISTIGIAAAAVAIPLPLRLRSGRTVRFIGQNVKGSTINQALQKAFAAHGRVRLIVKRCKVYSDEPIDLTSEPFYGYRATDNKITNLNSKAASTPRPTPFLPGCKIMHNRFLIPGCEEYQAGIAGAI